MSAGITIKGTDGKVLVTLQDGTELTMSTQTARVFANSILRQAAKADGVIEGHIVTMEVPA